MSKRKTSTHLGLAAVAVLLPAVVVAQATLTVDASYNLTYSGSSVGNALTVSYFGGVTTFADTAEVIDVINGQSVHAAGSGTNTVTVQGYSSISIYGNGGADVIRIVSSGSGSIAVDTGEGFPDDVILGNGMVFSILGAVTVDDADGGGSLTVDDSAYPVARNVTVGANQISGLALFPISFVGEHIVAVNVTTGSGDDTFSTTGWSGSQPATLTLDGGAGSDQFDVTAVTNLTQAIVGGDPLPPEGPGDQITADLSGATNVVFTGSSTASGFQGAWTFDDGSVTFAQIETYLPRVASQLVLVSGHPQSAAVNVAFSKPLVVRVLDLLGLPVAGVPVEFTPPGSGASATLTPADVTDSSGETQSTATANGVVGSYRVVASTRGVTGTVQFSLTNLPQPVPILSGLDVATLGVLLGLAALRFLNRTSIGTA